jgi:hypothetical protein
LFISLSAQEKIVLFFDFKRKELMKKKSSVDFSTWLETSGPVKILKIEGFCDSATNTYNKESQSENCL